MAPRQNEEVPELSYLPTYSQTRPPPDTGPPTAYRNVIRKVYPYSLRPVLLLTSFCTFLYLVLIAISDFKSIGRSGNNAVMNIFNIVTGALLMVVAVVEILGFVAALKANLKLATLYSRLAIPAFALVIAAEILGIVGHYIFKSRIISACVTNNTGAVASTGFGWWGTGGSTTVMTQADAQTYCNNSWGYNSTWNIVWLVVTAVLGIPFVMFSFAFVRQLCDPSSVRTRDTNLGWRNRRNQQPPSAQYVSGPYDPQSQHGAYSYPPAPYGAYAPPAGPPPTDANRDLPGYERGDMQGDFDDDRKSPVSPTGAYGYSGAGRPSTSRDRDTDKLDDEADAQKKDFARDPHHDDDDAPRI